jgi:hypothetical protein
MSTPGSRARSPLREIIRAAVLNLASSTFGVRLAMRLTSTHRISNQPNFAEWCTWYHRAGNPMFIPETTGGATAEANVFYAVGQHDAIGFSPFGIDSWTDRDNDLGKSYRVESIHWSGQWIPRFVFSRFAGSTICWNRLCRRGNFLRRNLEAGSAPKGGRE